MDDSCAHVIRGSCVLLFPDDEVGDAGGCAADTPAVTAVDVIVVMTADDCCSLFLPVAFSPPAARPAIPVLCCGSSVEQMVDREAADPATLADWVEGVGEGTESVRGTLCLLVLRQLFRYVRIRFRDLSLNSGN